MPTIVLDVVVDGAAVAITVVEVDSVLVAGKLVVVCTAIVDVEATVAVAAAVVVDDATIVVVVVVVLVVVVVVVVVVVATSSVDSGRLAGGDAGMVSSTALAGIPATKDAAAHATTALSRNHGTRPT